jgi:hypothetical protein
LGRVSAFSMIWMGTTLLPSQAPTKTIEARHLFFRKTTASAFLGLLWVACRVPCFGSPTRSRPELASARFEPPRLGELASIDGQFLITGARRNSETITINLTSGFIELPPRHGPLISYSEWSVGVLWSSAGFQSSISHSPPQRRCDEPDRPAHYHLHGAGRGAGAGMECAAVAT